MDDEDFQFFGYEQGSPQFLDDELMFENPNRDEKIWPPSPSFSLTSLSGDTDITESSCDDSLMTPEYSSPGISSPTFAPQIIATQTSFNNIQPVNPVPNSPNAPKNPFLSNNCKKRKLDGPENVEIILPRDVLRKTSCEELDEQVKLVTQYRELTPAEEYAVSRQRRLIKSRQYANNARNKKKIESEGLRQENDRLIAENNNMKQTITILQQEHQRLTAENNQFRLMLGNLGVPCPPAYAAPLPSLGPKPEPKTTININASSSFSPLSYLMPQPTQPQKPAVTKGKPTITPPPMGMTTLVLFVIMFSFAVFTLPNALSTLPGFEQFTQSSHFNSHSARRIFEDPLSTPNAIHLQSPSSRASELKALQRDTWPCSPANNRTFVPESPDQLVEN